MGRSRPVDNLFDGRTSSREFWARIRKRRSKVRRLWIRGFALAHPQSSITNEESPSLLQDLMKELPSSCKVLSTSSSFYTCWEEGSLQDQALWVPETPRAPCSSCTRREDAQSHQKPEHRHIKALAQGCLAEQLGFNRLDIVPAFGIHR